MTSIAEAPAESLTQLRRMKALATGLLGVAAVLYTVSVVIGDGHGGWVGYLRAGSEAAMVGGLADWFAVTAIFRRPLGLPIPHTALIPRQKDALAGSLGGFVTSHFLTAEAIQERVQIAEPTRKAGAFLAAPGRAESAAEEIARISADALDAIDPRDITEYVLELVRQDQMRRSYAPVIGRLMAQTVDGTTHQPLVDMLIERAHTFLVANETVVRREVKRMIEDSSFLAGLFATDKRVTKLIHSARETLAQMQGNAAHPLRRDLDTLLRVLATDLQSDSETSRRLDALIGELLEDERAHAIIGDLVGDAAASVRDSLRDPDGQLVSRIAAMLTRIAERAQHDEAFVARIDAGVQALVGYAVENYGDTLTKVIQDQVSKWSGADTAKKIEGFVGRDLQFIRLNGTAVGALAGLGIHAVTQLV